MRTNTIELSCRFWDEMEYLPTSDVVVSAISKVLPFAFYSVFDSALDAINESLS